MSHDLLKNLKATRDGLVSEMRGELDEATKRDGGLTAEDDAKIQRYDTDIAALDQRMKMVADALLRANDENDAVTRAMAGQTDPAAPTDTEAQIRSFLRGESRDLTVAPERRDLTKGTATAGGNTVPTSFYGQLLEHLIENSGILAAGATLLETASGENLEIPVTTAHSSGALVAEAGAISESDPAFAKRTLGAYKYGALIQVSRELVDDTGVDLQGYLSMQAGRAVGNALGVHLATGDASSKPSGIVTTATTGVTGSAAVAGVFTVDNLIDLFYSVIAPYRNSRQCGWILRDASIASMRKLKDGNDQYLWSPATAPGVPDTFLGKPVHSDPNIAAIAATAKSVVFGDISQYFVRLAGGVRFERSDEYAFNTDLITFKCVVRGDGILTDQTGAVKVFVGGAAS